MYHAEVYDAHLNSEDVASPSMSSFRLVRSSAPKPNPNPSPNLNPNPKPNPNPNPNPYLSPKPDPYPKQVLSSNLEWLWLPWYPIAFSFTATFGYALVARTTLLQNLSTPSRVGAS